MTQELFKAIAEAYRTTEDEMFAQSRKRKLVDARSMLAYVLVKKLGYTFEETASVVQRDRSTVFNMLNNMSNLLIYDEPTKAIYEKLQTNFLNNLDYVFSINM